MNLLAKIPDNWTRASVGKYCDIQLGKMLQTDPSSEQDELKPYLRAINIAEDGLDLSHDFSMWIRPQETHRFRLGKGDILVSEGGNAGRTAVFDVEGEYYIQNAINRVRPDHHRKIEPKFIYYWFTFLKIVGYVDMICNVATIPHFTTEKVKAAPLAFPPLEKQQQIARLLDEKTSRIDALIAKKERLLELLSENRQALIAKAVTQDLDSIAPTRQSQGRYRRAAQEVDRMTFEPNAQKWRLKWVFSSCKNGAWGAEPDGETDVVCIRAADFDGILGRLNGSERTLRSIYPEVFEKLALQSGDIILEKSGGGEKQLVGRAVLFDGEGPSITSNFLARCRPSQCVESAFINYLLLAIYNARGTFPHLKQSTGIQNLDLSSFLDIRVSVPSLKTQQRIAQFLDEKTAEIDNLATKVQRSLERLFEYRAALITAAVTGQIAELR